MAKRTTKRKRRLTFTIISGTVFIGILVGFFIFKSGTKKTYVPGEEIEGLTSDLTRDLPSNYPKITFTDVTIESGIQFNHYSGERTIQLPEDMGSGAAWGDYDNDGWEDIFLANFSGSLDLSEEELQNSTTYSQLYHNNQDGTFTEVSALAGVDLRAWANACAWGDYDSDGWLDLFVSSYGKNYLYRNKGDGTFEDAGQKTRINKYENYWAGVTWGDYDLDGNPDIYVCGYVDYQSSANRGVTLQYSAEVPTSINPSSFKPIRNLLFHNNGNGTFSEVAEKAGVMNETGRSLSASWCDFDDDGLPDLYVANDVSDNALFRNKGDGTFEDVSYTSFVADYRGAMGIGSGDWDNDGDFDMFITHWIAQENALYSNLLAQLNTKDISTSNRIKFMDEADRYGLGQIALEFIGFGTFFFDYDNDTKLDIFIANGSTFQKRDNQKELIPMKDQLLWNQGSKEGFFDLSMVSGNYFTESFVGRGAAYADFDNDGDLDVLVINNLGPAKLLRNDGGNKQNWIKLKLKKNQSNTFALGTKVRLVSGQVEQVRQVGSQGSYFSQNSLIQHFGLGEHSNVDTLEITWPGGKRLLRLHIKPNQLISLSEQ
jgi:hypothetical protein